MSRQRARYKPLVLDRLSKKAGQYHDGGGLYLLVKSPTSRSWLFRYMRDGRAREMGLGPYPDRTLADARVKAGECRKLLLDDIDPIEHRRSRRTDAKLEAAKAITFDTCAERYIEAHKSGWRNAKHADQWSNTLAAYASPVFGKLSVVTIDTALVMKVLETIWNYKPETAYRLRGRIEAILDWAKVRGYRQGENPARWRGHLDKLLPSRAKVRKVEHHAALPYVDMPTFMAELREQSGLSALALQFTILTAARTGETIGARWREFDLDARTWTVPADRMKANREHRVPLSESAFAILAEMRILGREADDYVFPGGKKTKPLSNMAMMMMLRRMGREDLTVHGFRSTFRDWCAEQTTFPSEVAEMALAHAVGDKVEAAYRRGDMFDRRRSLANDWGIYCVGQGQHAG